MLFDVTSLKDGERIDDLLIGGLKIIQNESEFCFSLDAILLAHFATVRQGGQAVDLGTGTGVIPLLLTTRGIGYVSGVEFSPSMAEMASRSIALNELQDKVKIVHGDLCKVRELLPAEGYDLVVSNPPYRPVGGGFISPNDRVAMAKHEVTATLQDVVNAARYLLKTRGRFAMVHLPERMSEILVAMSLAGLEPKRLQLVHSGVDKKPKMLLVEGIRGGKPGLEVLPPLIVYQPDGSYHDEIQKYYKEFR